MIPRPTSRARVELHGYPSADASPQDLGRQASDPRGVGVGESDALRITSSGGDIASRKRAHGLRHAPGRIVQRAGRLHLHRGPRLPIHDRGDEARLIRRVNSHANGSRCGTRRLDHDQACNPAARSRTVLPDFPAGRVRRWKRGQVIGGNWCRAGRCRQAREHRDASNGVTQTGQRRRLTLSMRSSMDCTRLKGNQSNTIAPVRDDSKRSRATAESRIAVRLW